MIQLSAALAGFSLAFSLILAIGAQNAFVLKQGLVRQHVFLVCAICALSDALLIAAGVAGFGALVAQFPLLETAARYGGALFLLVYGLLSFKSAATTDHALGLAEKAPASALKTAAICLAFTWLNPHVYLDTVVLLGSVSTQYGASRLYFALGAMTSSFVFFFSLGYGARLLAPLFRKPVAWKYLEVLVGVIMVSLAVMLVSY